MALKHIPFVKGVDESADPSVLPEGFFARAENVRVVREGRLAKRPGTKAESIALTGGGSLSGSTEYVGASHWGNLVVADSVLYAQTAAGWSERGVAPCAVPETMWDATLTEDDWPDDCVCLHVNKYLVVAYRYQLDASSSLGVVAKVFDARTRALVSQLVVPTTPLSPQLVRFTDTDVRLTMLSGSALVYYTADFSDSGNATFGTSATMAPSVSVDYRVFPAGDDSHVFLFRQSGTNLIMDKLDASNSVVATSTLALGGGVVSHRLTACTDGSYVYAGWWNKNDTTVYAHTWTVALASPSGVKTVQSPSGTRTPSDSPVTIAVDPGGGAFIVYEEDDSSLTGRGWFSWKKLSSGGTLTSGTNSVNLHIESEAYTAAGRRLVWVRPGTNQSQTKVRRLVLLDLGDTADIPIAVLVADGLLDQSRRPDPKPWPVSTDAAGRYYLCAPNQLRGEGETYRQGSARVWEWTSTDTEGLGSARGTVFVDGVAHLPGGVLTQWDGETMSDVGQVLTPEVVKLTGNVGSGSMALGTYQYSVVFERTDAAGRIHRSAPSVPKTITTTGSQNEVIVELGEPGAFREPWEAHVYRTLSNGSIFFRVTSLTGGIEIGTPTFTDTLADAPASTRPVLYTDGGRSPADVAPASRFGVTAIGRMWLGGLFRAHRVRCSAVTVSGEGLAFPEDSTHWLDLPEAVTGLAAMDDAVLAFTRSRIFVITGDGPTDASVGTFPAPREIPTEVGCINWRSIVSTSSGVFFQSDGGLFLLPRGFGPPVYVGRAVADTLESFPYVADATAHEDGNHAVVRFAVLDDEISPTDGRVLTFSMRSGVWTVDDHGAAIHHLERWTDAATGLRTVALSRRNLSDTDPIRVERGDLTPEDAVVTTLETGELHPDGKLLAQQRIQRVWLRGIYRGACELTIAAAFDGSGSFSTATTFALSGLTAGDKFVREWRLPVQACESVRFRFSDDGETSGGAPTKGIDYIGATIEWQDRQRGARVAEGSRN